MALLQSRPEKDADIMVLVYALRNKIAEAGRSGDLNLAEVVIAMGQAMSSVLVGAYDPRNREIVLDGIPDLIRACFPQWEAIYRDARVPTPAQQEGQT